MPMCWEVEILPVGPTDAESDGVLARYVSLSDLEGCRMVVLRHEGTDLT